MALGKASRNNPGLEHPNSGGEDSVSHRVPLLDAISSVEELSSSLWPKLLRPPGRSGPIRFACMSPRGGAGTTLVSSAAAVSLARNLNKQVVLAELNLARPALAGYLAARSGPGLGEHLLADATLEQCRIEVGSLPNLKVFPAGRPRRLRHGVFSASRMGDMARELQGHAEYVIYDAPPLLEFPGTLLLLEQVDAVILVARARETAKRDLARCTEMLDDAGAQVMGVVLNAYEPDLPGFLEGLG